MASPLFATCTPRSSLQLRRNRMRRVILETLEKRELLAADSAGVIFAPGTPQAYVDSVIDSYLRGSTAEASGESDAINLQGSRWSNPTGGPSANQGDPAVVTWSIVPDGTVDSANNSTTNLIAFMDNIYGGGTGPVEQRPWFNIFQRAYDRWSELSGLTFVYEANDDGASMGGNNRGVTGVRGDVRIGGRPIDGNFGVLAFNYFPNNGGNGGFDGDMIIDTNDVFFFNSADGPNGENRGNFNVIAHESGHGIGLGHVIPVDETKLMEPFASVAFLGPQHDDILGAQQLYGDTNENDDARAGATDLGSLGNGLRSLTNVSIDRANDDDWYQFTVESAGKLNLTLQPIGQQYQVGPQGGTAVGVDTLRNLDLSMELVANDGTVLAQVNGFGLGEAEQLLDFDLPAGGTYFVRVIGEGAANADPQLYDLTFQTRGFTGVGVVVVPPRLLSVGPNADEIFNFNRTNSIETAPNELVFRFDGAQLLGPEALTGIRITRSGFDGDFTDGDEVVITPGWTGFGESERIVITRFAESLPDDLYRVEVFGVDIPSEGITAVRNIVGDALKPRVAGTDRDTILFDLELGNEIIAVVPQPTSREVGTNRIIQARDQIEVYFSEGDRLHATDVATGQMTPNPTVVDPSFYRLFADRGTVTNTDDQLFLPIRVEYFAARNMARLTFATNIDQLDPTSDTSFRLRVGTNEVRPAAPTIIPQPIDPGSTFNVAGAADLGVLSTISSLQVSEQIVNSSVFPLDFPGAPDNPGSREVVDDPSNGEGHLLRDNPDSNTNLTVQFYNFNKVDPVTTDATGQQAFNSISPAQEQRAREVFELYGSILGISFVETENQGWTIATANIDGVSGTIGVANGISAIMDAAESWNDEFGASDDPNKLSWFTVAMHEIGHLLGLGHATELPPGSIMGGLYRNDTLGGEPSLLNGVDVEPIFPGATDEVSLKYLHRPDSRDIDMYRFEVAAGSAGEFTAQVVAERLPNSSLLDSVLSLYRELPDGSREVIAVNDDYFSEDSYIRLDLQPGVYYLGVSASGNSDYNPEIADSGLGGVSEGAYQLRTTFRPLEASSIVDEDGSAVDGDADGEAGGVFNYWFNAAAPNGEQTAQRRTLFVDKLTGTPAGNGSRLAPFQTINAAFAAAQPGDIVRLVANGGADGIVATQADNRAFEVGTGGLGNQPLSDGATMNVPRGVNVMVDAGVLFKMGRSVIGIGSSTSSGDRSRASFQVLGTPEQEVFFTSYTDQNLGVDTDPLNTVPQAGDWGGIIFRNELDRAEGRFDAELSGRFLNYVGYANMRYGGGQVPVDGQNTVITPLHMVTARPTLINNTITNSAFAAMSANPNSFEETTFIVPRYQSDVIFTPDYTRVGPDIHGNTVNTNSINGLFVRVETPAGQTTASQTVAARWDDSDIVHVVADTLTVRGTPGGPLLETKPVEVALVNISNANQANGTLVAGQTYRYRMTFEDANGNEGVASAPTLPFTLGTGSNAIRLTNLPSAGGDFVARKIYRSDNGGPFQLVAELDRSSTVYVDGAAQRGSVLNTAATLNRARLDANLVIDPGMIVKLQSGRIVAGVSAQLVAEGRDGMPVIFTSRQDDRYGAGSTFDTNGDGANSTPRAGDWGGLYFSQAGSGSLDNAIVSFGGGVTGVGGAFGGFNAIEIHQSDVRIANTVIEDNAAGTGGIATANRGGAGFNVDAAIFVRGAEPVLVDNVIRNNQGAAISIDAQSLSGNAIKDKGRVTGLAERRVAITENKGPLLSGNALGDNKVNALSIRGGTLITESVWDDSDIVHAVFDEIVVPDLFVFGGLRLQSSPDESLVVKFGPAAGLTSNGRPLDIDDRVGGSLQVVGSPGFPVVLTSIADDSVGSGFDPEGRAQVDTNGDGGSTLPNAGDWRSLRIDEFSNDRNVVITTEAEPAQSTGAGVNGTPGNAQNVGFLARGENASDDNLRLGFTVVGTINNIDDIDVYSFQGTAGTQVWFDIDRTNISLDAVLELVDSDGNIIAQSDNSLAESGGANSLFSDPAAIETSQVNAMQTTPYSPRNFGSGPASLTSTFADFYSTNPLDPGMRLVLPGATGSVNTYFIRVRSSNIDSRDASANPADLQDPAKLRDGKTEGQYQLQIRLRETDEFAGSSISFADIRYATSGIEILGGPSHSPLVGEAVELTTNNNTIANALDLGNLLNTDLAALSIAGDLNSTRDVDWYRFEVNGDSLQSDGLVQHLAAMIDVDYADGFGRANTSLWLYYDDQNGLGGGTNTGIRLVNFGTDSNIADDFGAPLNGSDADDLSRGSAGLLDAFIGSTALPSGTYFLAITSNELISNYIAQLYAADAGGNPLTRIEPINSVTRLIEDRFGGSVTTATGPVQVGFAGTASQVPYTLADIPLLITQRAGTAVDTSELITVSPITGVQTSLVSRFPYVEDAAIRGDGTLHGARSPQTGVINDANSGGILDIDVAGDGATAAVTTGSGIVTYELDRTVNPPAAAVALTPGTNAQRQGVGMEFRGLSYPQIGNTQFLYAAGSRGDGSTTWVSNAGNRDSRNYIYKLDPTSLAAVSAPQVDRVDPGFLQGAGTTIRERGYVDTSRDTAQNATYQTIIMDAASPTGAPSLLDGDRVTVRTPSGDVVLQWQASVLSGTLIANTSPQSQINSFPPVPTNLFQDGETFTLTAGANTRTFEIDTGRVLVNNYVTQANPPSYNTSTFSIVDLNGNRVTFEFDPDNNAAAPNERIVYDQANATRAQVTQAIIAAINNPTAANILDAAGNQSTLPWTVQAFLLPGTDRISLTGDYSVVLAPETGAAPNPLTITTIDNQSAPSAIFDGATFSITDQDGDRITFEFDVNGSVTPGNAPIVFQTAWTQQFFSQAINAAINNPPAAILNNLAGAWDVQSILPAGGNTLRLLGDSFVTYSTAVSPLLGTAEYAGTNSVNDSGRFAVNRYADPPGAAYDGAIFTIVDESGDTAVFEYDSEGTVGATNGVNHVPIDITSNTRATISQLTVAAINNPPSASVAPGGAAAWTARAFLSAATDEIRLIGDSAFVLDSQAPNPLQISRLTNTLPGLLPGQSYDGATFAITDLDGDAIRFEFDADGIVAVGNQPIAYNPATVTANVLTQAIVNAITAPSPAILTSLVGSWDVQASQTATDELELFGDALVVITASTATVVNPVSGTAEYKKSSTDTQRLATNLFGTLPASETYDGAVFTVANQTGTQMRFEFDTDGVVGTTGGVGHTPITISATDTRESLTGKIAAVIAGANWDVDASAVGVPNQVRLRNDQAFTLAPQQFEHTLTNTFAGNPTDYDGATFTITDRSGDTLTFEFDSNNSVSPGNVALVYNPVTVTKVGLTAAIAAIINNPPPAAVGALAGNWEGKAVLVPGTDRMQLTDVDTVVLALGAAVTNPLATQKIVSPLQVTRLTNVFPMPGVGQSYDGATFTITDGSGDTITFEFDSNSSITPGNQPISFTAADTRADLTLKIHNTINLPSPAVLAALAGNWDVQSVLQAGADSIQLFGDTNVSFAANTATVVNPLAGSPEYGTAEAPDTDNVLVPIEEFYINLDQFLFPPNPSTPGAMDELIAAINGAKMGITASSIGTRLILTGATAANFANITSITSNTSGAGADILLPFQFTDSANVLNNTLFNAILTIEPNALRMADGRIWLPNSSAFVQNQTDDRGDSPSKNAQLSAPVYGYLEGIGFAGNTMFAVSENGDLFRVGGTTFNPNSTNNNGDFIDTIYNTNTRQRVNFVGLTSGPRNVEGGAFTNILFGIDSSGILYAFDTQGRPAPIFEDGAWFVQTAATNPSGLSFANLDVNLWHTTANNRNNDDGHGVNVSFDGSRRTQQQGGNSLYFGFENPQDPQRQVGNWTGVNDPGANFPGYDPLIYDTYDFTGGAKGSIVSNTLDLSNYSAGDKPMLYFNYYLQTEDSNANNPTNNAFMKDALRVFIAGDDGDWQLVGTNNSDYDATRNVGQRDELDYPFEVDPLNAISRQVSELFDAGVNGAPDSWRQARVDLSRWAGNESVRIRFDFSTAGSFDVGGTGGVELVAIAGDKLRAGQTFQIDNTTFEFDLGLVLQIPSGGSLTAGQTFEVEGVTYTFATDNTGDNIQFDSTESGATIAARLLAKLQARGLSAAIDPLVPSRVAVLDAVNPFPVIDPTLPGSFVSDVPGVVPGREAVLISNAMTADEVRDAIRVSIARTFNVPGQENNISVVRFNQQSIFLYNHTIVDAGPLGSSVSLQGDEYGERISGTTTVVGRGAERGQNNRFEGVYIDDIIVGFAERGEMVTYQNNDTPTDETFVVNPHHEPAPGYDEIETGTYQIEIRRGATYGIGGNNFPSLGLAFSFDTNDRLAQQVSIVADSGAQIADGQTFQLSDGIDTVTYEYDDLSIVAGPNVGVAQGNIRIPFNSTDTPQQMAIRLRDAINSPQSRASLDLVAGLSDGTVTGSFNLGLPTGSEIVNIHGSVAADNQGSNNFGGTRQTTLAGTPQPGFVLHAVDTFRPTETGDSNRRRVQGQVVVHSNIVRNSSNVGIVIDAGARVNNGLIPLAGALPHPGSVRNLVQFNQQDLIPGPVVINNLLYANAMGGILFSGDTRSTTTPEAPTPFGRIVNNTVVGLNGLGIGINVTDNASPTLLNNIVSSFATGIAVDATSSTTVVGATTFQNNGNNGTVGTDAQTLGPAEPLFVNAAGQNYYPAAGSRVIDSSIDTQNDRQAMTTVRSPMGIAVSPILAPDADITGQLRVDDPVISNPNGTGGNPFKDRGAFDRSDFFGPLAVIQQPIDNDPDNLDVDRFNTFIRLASGTLDSFSILLVEPQGTGPDASTVTVNSVAITQNGRLLQPGIDYVFGYSPASRLLRLTPLSGIWRSDSVYEITLNNQAGIRISSASGQFLSDSQSFTVDVGGNTLTFEYDSDGNVATGSIPIPLDTTYSEYQMASLLVAALNQADPNIFAYLLGDGTLMVHGADAVTGLAAINVGAIADIAGNPLQANRISSLTQFTIVMPEVQLDYGDASGANSTTLQSDNGARHAILPVDAPSLALGQIVDGDPNGQPSAASRADDNESAFLGSTIPGLTIGNAGPGVFVAPVPSAALDGQQLIVQDVFGKSVTFEFDTDGTLSSTSVASIDISAATTAADVAAAIRDAANGALLRGELDEISAVAVGATVDLGGTRRHMFDNSAAPSLVRSVVGSFDLVLPSSGFADGQYIEILDGDNRTVRFELNDISGGVAPLVESPNVLVNVDLTTATPADIAVAFADAMNARVAANAFNVAPVTVNGTTISVLGDDEDGVTFGGLFNAQSAPVPVTVTSTGTGILDVWFDWNADGDFSDAGERVVANQLVQPGDNVIMVATPSTAAIGFTSSRFRVSATGNLLLGGLAIGGEVEDHVVEVVGGTPPSAADDTYTVLEDETLVVTGPGLLANDTIVGSLPLTVVDADSNTPGIQPTVAPANGTVTLLADGSFNYTPRLDFFGTDTFQYDVRTDRLQSAQSATVTITVEPVNDRPTAVDDTLTLLEDEGFVKSIDEFLANDSKGTPGAPSETNELGQTLDIISAVMINPVGLGGSITLANNELTFVAPADYNDTISGPVLIELTIRDSGPAGADAMPLESTSTLTIHLTAVNDIPLLEIPTQEVTVFEDNEAITGQEPTVFTGFATAYAVGPATATDEIANQVATLTVISNSNPGLFDLQPTITPSGDLVFSTAPERSGRSVVIMQLMDSGPGPETGNGDANATTLKTFTITVTEVNDAPSFDLPTTVTVNEDAGSVTLQRLATNIQRGPAGSEGNQLVSFTVVALEPSSFAVQPAMGVDGTLTFETAANANSLNADLRVTVQLTDNGASSPAPNANMSAIKTLTIDVAPVNDAPTADAFTIAGLEDNELVIQSGDVLVGDIPGPTPDEDGQTLRITQIGSSSSRGGTVTPVFGDASDPSKITSMTYRPPVNLSGIDFIQYVVTDNGSPQRSGTGTITVNLAAINDAPQFTRGADQVSAEDSGSVTVSNWVTGIMAGPASATDELANQTVSFEAVALNPGLFVVQPSIASDGTLSYTPALDANGTSLVTVRAIDDGSADAPNINASATQTFTITVSPVNDAPVFTPGGDVTVAEDSGAQSSPWATNIAAAAGLLNNPQTAVDESTQGFDFSLVVDRPELFTIAPAVDSAGNLTFTPQANAFGAAVVQVTLVDRGASTAPNVNRSTTQTFTITITPANDAPTAVDDSYTTNEDSVLTIPANGLLANDSDVDFPADSISAIAGNIVSDSGVNVTLNADGSVVYDAQSLASFQQLQDGQSVFDRFVYRIQDSSGTASQPATVTIRVDGINDAPVAVDDQFAVGAGRSLDLAVLANDTDVDSTIDNRTISVTSSPAFGSVQVSAVGVIRYTPDSGFRGNDTFRYTVRDSEGRVSNEAIVTISVNTAPVANGDNASTFKNTPVDIDVAANDTDSDGSIDRATVVIQQQPTNGTVQVVGNGLVRFTPNTDFTGQANFSYSISDNTGTASNVANVTVRVLNSRWQNPQANLDVNGDGSISPIDALILVNYLNGDREPFLPNSGIEPAPFLDPNGDEFITPSDVLLVINFLNAAAAGGGAEGELSTADWSAYAMMVTPQQVIETVGAQVVEEIQQELASIRASAIVDQTVDAGSGEPIDSQADGSQEDDEDDLIELLSCSQSGLETAASAESVDFYFSGIGPKRK
ncbi:MAG: tandem-95 repeat protein [Planctomycetales bacterium]|nr:tandem-95 repeat protein [Planctomycetales bacterium]